MSVTVGSKLKGTKLLKKTRKPKESRSWQDLNHLEHQLSNSSTGGTSSKQSCSKSNKALACYSKQPKLSWFGPNWKPAEFHFAGAWEGFWKQEIL